MAKVNLLQHALVRTQGAEDPNLTFASFDLYRMFYTRCIALLRYSISLRFFVPAGIPEGSRRLLTVGATRSCLARKADASRSLPEESDRLITGTSCFLKDTRKAYSLVWYILIAFIKNWTTDIGFLAF